MDSSRNHNDTSGQQLQPNGIIAPEQIKVSNLESDGRDDDSFDSESSSSSGGYIMR